MNQYLVVLSIGPVQSMIAAARRSRDLWSGSWLLSELSKACAKSLYEQKAKLVFPSVEKLSDLAVNSDFSVGNKIQALVEASDVNELMFIIDKAKQATQQRFEQEANAVLEELDSPVKADIRDSIWHRQKKGYIEIQAAWAKVDKSSETGYIQAVQNATSTLAARKATRDFAPAATNPYEQDYMLPKCSLDGAFETVLAKADKQLKQTTRRKLSLSDSEQLDCLGVIKRRGFKDKAEQFTAFTRVAAHAWIAKLIADGVDLTKIKNIYEKLVEQNVASRIKGNQGIYKDFAYDAQLLYSYRLDAEIKKWQGNDDAVSHQLNCLKEVLKPIWKDYGEPYGYGVMLLADGDRMGELLDKAKSLEQHRAITQALSEFAQGVAGIMREYKGHCIYAGGDDVLGLLPLDTAYACSKELSESFENTLEKVSQGLGAKTPTLSVGLAICHIMTPMNVIRDLAKQAEKHAKGDHIKDDLEKRRNALSVLLSVRSGSDIQVRYQWSDTDGLDTFTKWVKCYVDKSIPSRVAYDIRDIYLRTRFISQDEMSLQKDIQTAELERMLKQARTNDGKIIDEKTIQELKTRGNQIGLDKLADELIVARWFAAKTQKELGKE